MQPAVSRRPILVSGPPRGGTTWVGKTLALDPRIGYLHEPFSVVTRPGLSAAPFPRMFEYVDEANQQRYAPSLARTLRFDYDVRAEVRAVRSARDVARGVRDAAAMARMRRRRARPLMKDPIAVFSAEWLAREFDMDVVLVVRHPAAVAASFKRLGWQHRFESFLEQPRLVEQHLPMYTDQIRDFAQTRRTSVEQAALLWALVGTMIQGYEARHPTWVVVRQEDLSLRPVEEFEAVFRRVGLELTPSIRAEIVSNSSSANPSELARAHDIRLDSAASLGGWRRALSTAEIDSVRALAGDVAQAFGYGGDW